MSEPDSLHDLSANSDSTHRRNPSIDPPSVFLRNLTSKVQIDARTNSVSHGSVAEVQRIKADLSNKIQNILNNHEMSSRQFDSQLSALGHEVKSKLQNLERQQGFSRKQLEELHERLETLSSEDISTLQYQFDELGTRFDRFMRVEVESKLRPLQEQIRQFRAKLDGLTSNSESDFRKLRESIRILNQKIQSTVKSIDEHQRDLDTRFHVIDPKIVELETEIKTLGNLITGSVNSGPILESDSKRFRDLQNRSEKLQNEIVPIEIQGGADQILDRLSEINNFCETECSKLTSKLSSMTCTNQVAEQQRINVETSLDQLMKSAFEIQSKLDGLEQDATAKLTGFENSLEAAQKTIKTQLEDDVNQSEKDVCQELCETAISDLRGKMAGKCRKLKGNVRGVTGRNEQSQKAAIAELAKIHEMLKGKGNLLERLDAIEKGIEWCVKLILLVDKERVEVQEKGGAAAAVLTRIESVKERIAGLQGRIVKREGGGGGGNPDVMRYAPMEEPVIAMPEVPANGSLEKPVRMEKPTEEEKGGGGGEEEEKEKPEQLEDLMNGALDGNG
jgi:predicted secreted Zn-dependent protease